MNIAYNWLKEYIDLPETVEQIADKLTASGLEVEGISPYEQIKGGLKGLVIGEVLSAEKHPNADKLKVTKVEVANGEILPIVCGAPNVAAGQKVVVATVGTTLYPLEGEPFEIKKAKIRGEVSQGMICAEDEIGLSSNHDGIMVLDTDLPNGTPAQKYFNIAEDSCLSIGLTPNRADATSHLGVARELSVLLDRPFKLPDLQHFAVDNQNLTIPVKVENTEACPRYAGITISGVSVGDSPEWLQNRLRSIGLSPINNVVDITNFVLHELGQPLHAFDADQIEGNEVIVKTLAEGSKFTTLDEKERQLRAQDLMICNQKEGMCMAGVFGGIKSGVSKTTKNIFLESAYFSPDYIRRTAQHHGLKTDASFRFERGTDPNMVITALKRAALLIKEIAGGSISSEIVDVYPEPIPHFELTVRYRNINRLIGKDFSPELVKKILKGLEIEMTAETTEELHLKVPPYRVDVQREVDIIEEIARLYGYDNIEIPDYLGASFLAEFPSIDAQQLQQHIAENLSAQGFNEIVTNSLTKPAYAEQLGEEASRKNVVILNKLSEDLEVMRQSLLFSGLEVLAYNINRRQKDVKVFEFGKIYQKSAEQGYREEKQLALFVSGQAQSESWQGNNKASDFYTLANAVRTVLQRLNQAQPQTKASDLPFLGEQIAYYSGKKLLARLGQVRREALEIAGIKQAVFFAEIYWENLLQNYSAEVVYQEISKFPEVRRDLSLVLEQSVKFEEIQRIALETERRLLKDVNVFDVYEGKNLGEGKKAYALSFILEDKTQTLKDKQIEKTMQKLMQAFEKKLGAVIRK